MGPPSANTRDKGSQRDNTKSNHSHRVTPIEKTSLELLLESTERSPAFADTQQFGLLRDSLVFNHERILQHTPPEEIHSLSQRGLRSATEHHYPPLHRIDSLNDTFAESDPHHAILHGHDFYALSDRTVQNRANANLDRNVGWQIQQLPVRDHNNDEIEPVLTRTGLSLNASGDIPLTNTAASIHLPSPPNSDLFRGSMERPSATTVTTVYSYKCNRISKHIPEENGYMDDIADPLYEEEIQEVPYQYGSRITRHQPENVDRTTSDEIGNEEDLIGEPLQEQEENVQKVESIQNSMELEMVPAQPTGDYATGYGNAGSGDFQNNNPFLHSQQRCFYQQHGIDWDSVAHPSHDMYGPVLAHQYYTRRQLMGRNHPAFAYLTPTFTFSDDDFDDDLIDLRQQQPFFPNPASLKYPEYSYLKMTLDPKYHPFLEPGCKKDCRTWLWKNAKGRRARELLAAGKTPSKASLSFHQRIPTPTNADDVQNTRKAFCDNDELEDENNAVGLQNQ